MPREQARGGGGAAVPAVPPAAAAAVAAAAAAMAEGSTTKASTPQVVHERPGKLETEAAKHIEPDGRDDTMREPMHGSITDLPAAPTTSSTTTSTTTGGTGSSMVVGTTDEGAPGATLGTPPTSELDGGSSDGGKFGPKKQRVGRGQHEGEENGAVGNAGGENAGNIANGDEVKDRGTGGASNNGTAAAIASMSASMMDVDVNPKLIVAPLAAQPPLPKGPPPAQVRSAAATPTPPALSSPYTPPELTSEQQQTVVPQPATVMPPPPTQAQYSEGNITAAFPAATAAAAAAAASAADATAALGAATTTDAAVAHTATATDKTAETAAANAAAMAVESVAPSIESAVFDSDEIMPATKAIDLNTAASGGGGGAAATRTPPTAPAAANGGGGPADEDADKDYNAKSSIAAAQPAAQPAALTPVPAPLPAPTATASTPAAPTAAVAAVASAAAASAAASAATPPSSPHSSLLPSYRSPSVSSAQSSPSSVDLGLSPPASLPVPRNKDHKRRKLTFNPKRTTAAAVAALASSQDDTPSAISEIFEGKLAYTTRCLSCDASSRRSEPFLDLTLPASSLPGRSITWALSQLCDVQERMHAGNKYFCSVCNRHTEARIHTPRSSGV